MAEHDRDNAPAATQDVNQHAATPHGAVTAATGRTERPSSQPPPSIATAAATATAEATAEPTTGGGQRAYCEEDLVALRGLYDPGREQRRARTGGATYYHPFAGAITWDRAVRNTADVLRWLPATTRQAQELDAVQRRAADDARQTAHGLGLRIRQRLAELEKGPQAASEDDSEIAQLLKDLQELKGDLDAALTPPVDINSEHGVTMIIGQVVGARADLHEAIDDTAAIRHSRADVVTATAAPAIDAHAPAQMRRLHSAIDDWAANCHDLAEASAARAWTTVCAHALHAHTMAHDAADTGSATAANTRAVMEQRLPGPTQNRPDGSRRTTNAGAAAGTVGKDAWLRAGRSGRVKPPAQR